MNVERLKRFVLSRKNEDGGFSFCKPLPSSVPETFYAVFILKAIGCEVGEDVVEFLLNRLRPEVPTMFYVFNALNVLGVEPPDYSEFLLKRLDEAVGREISGLSGERGITATYSFENPNVLREIYMIVSCLRILNVEVDLGDFVRRFKRGKGYGVNSPNLKDTFFAVGIKEDEDVIEFVMEHECDCGGFSKKPNSYPPYLEDTFYAISTLNVLNFNYKNGKTVKYILSLQNSDGGFRRSIYGGISTLEDSYYAIASLKIMGVEERSAYF